MPSSAAHSAAGRDAGAARRAPRDDWNASKSGDQPTNRRTALRGMEVSVYFVCFHNTLGVNTGRPYSRWIASSVWFSIKSHHTRVHHLCNILPIQSISQSIVATVANVLDHPNHVFRTEAGDLSAELVLESRVLEIQF